MKFSKKGLKEDILKEGMILRMHSGAVESIADRVVEKTAKWVEKRSTITKTDLDQKVAKELEQYSRDLAYVYQNRGKII